MSQTLEKKDIIGGDLVYYHYDKAFRTFKDTSRFLISAKTQNPPHLFDGDMVFCIIRKGLFYYVDEI